MGPRTRGHRCFVWRNFVNNEAPAPSYAHAPCVIEVLPNYIATIQLFVAAPKLGVILGRAD
eukprot:8436452-Pyramimonas_sp.AAC.1